MTVRLGRRGAARAAALGALACLGACAGLAPEPRAPAVLGVMPPSYEQAELPPDHAPAAWWRSFQDPILNHVVERALEANLDLAASATRIAEAEARLRQSRAGRLPSLSGQIGGSYQSLPAGAAFGGLGGGLRPGVPGGGVGGGRTPGGPTIPGGPGPDRIEAESWSTNLNASFQPDLWGGAAAAEAAARAQLRSARAQHEAARLRVLATTIQAYLDVTYLRRAIQLTLAQVDALRARARATEARYERGLASSFEVYGVRAQRRSAEAQLPRLEARLSQAEAALALVLGRYAEDLDELLERPFRPQLSLETPAPGAPVAILIQRPDVLAAAEQLEAARLQVGVARAQLFPNLSLSATLGTQGDRPQAAVNADNWLANLSANLTQPIFQGGALRAEVAGAEARYAAAAAQFAQAVLQAHGDVETAYAGWEETRQLYRFLAAQRDEAAATLQLQAERYAAGLGEFAAYLDAEVDLISAEQALAEASRDLAGARLSIHRALGGQWAAGDVSSADPDLLLERILGPGAAP